MLRSGRQLKNHALEAELFRRRALVGFLGVLLALGGLAAWYFRLQVVQHAEYATRSEANRVRLVPVVPARGLILDRKGRILADNVSAWRLDAVPERAGDGAALLAKLQRVVAIDAEQGARFLRDYRASRPFKPVPVKLKLSDEEAARFAVDRWRYPGVELVPYLGRVYPHGPLFAHVVGYVGRIDEKDQAALGPAGSAYSHTGKTGLERYYDGQLRGKPGYRRLETNVDGRTVRALDTVPATPGTDLRLSIDLDLQRAMVDAFGELEGTAVAVDPRSGEILAMVSLPAYDTNLFVNGISHADYRALNDNPSRPQFNRAVLGGVAPGSTIKPLLALAGLDSGVRRAEDKTLSTGMFHVGGQRRGYGDSHRGGHGWTDLRKSIYESVNTYYYRLALDMGIARFDEYMDRYGFGKPTGVDLSGEIAGILPSPEWKAKNAPAQGRWYPGDTVISGIGQGFWKVTPMQMAQATAALADGWLRRPHLVKDMRAGFAAEWTQVELVPPTRISDNPAHLQAVREGMIATVHGPGTATNIRPGLAYLIASKTGTAQVVSRRGNAAVNPRSLPMHLRHRGLFIAYAPADAPTIAIAVAIEGGGYGASSAAPVARKVLDAWLLGKMPVPAPAQAAAGDPAVAASADADPQAVPPVATEPAR
ncbi:MAG: penicillin-binding protein 2 [Thermomonas sp.]|nr:penicillin-binding protein 2 [Thermomonas sp.]MBK9669909.1 penicillin-binding protein 2 [Thermomonas sp.]MBL0228268.1 penicillin-binding protein 2 [Thermomonas sp.]